MTSPFKTLDGVDVSGKRVLLRVDLNVPMDNGVVTDATRIERVIPTIEELSMKGAKVILLAHLGRPKGVDPKESLRPVAAKRAREPLPQCTRRKSSASRSPSPMIASVMSRRRR